MINWKRKMVKTMKLVIILMNCVVKKKQLILTQVRSAQKKNLKIMYSGNKDTGQENNSLAIEIFTTLTVH